MKRVLLLIPALSFALCLGCPVAGGGNASSGDANRTVGGNANHTGPMNAGGGGFGDRERKTVFISVSDQGGGPAISVSPTLIRVPKNRKLRFVVVNNLEDRNISKVELLFVDAARGKTENPFDSDFVTGRLAPGEDRSTDVRGVKGSVAAGRRFGYTVRVHIDGMSPIDLDPQVEIVGAL